MYHWWHFLAESAARALPFPTSQRPTCPFHSLPVAPARPSAAFTSARHEPIPANRLQPGSPTCPAWPSATSAPARCEPFSAFPLLPGSSTCPAWPSAVSAAARCEPFPPNRLTPSSRDSGIPARHYGSGRPGTGSLLRCFCVEQEAVRSRGAAQQNIYGLPRR